MSVRTTSEQMAGPIGKELACSDDVTQAEFFNGFCEMLVNTCGGSAHNQLCWIADRLTPKTRKVIQELSGFCDLIDNPDV